MNDAEEIYLTARELPAGERDEYLRFACRDDAALRSRVEFLLKRAEQADDFFVEATAAAADSTAGLQALLRQNLPQPLGEGEGSVIGRYKLLQQIGTGGMGAVYMAEQEEPVRRRVALKIIKLGMDTRQVVARFEAERQALAMMDHPNIARVLDAGATESGRPYFVMELVQGIPITEFCDRNRLSLRERIELFLPVCRAIQSAHQKGVIHRDIKPSNVMVTLHHGEPMPKVIDFGVAKATNQRLTDKTVFTQFGAMIGTPAYMSPEQAELSSLDVDTRSDVYSLGVLLYELLTGSTPFPQERLKSLGFGQIQKVISEEEPPAPSTRMSTLQGDERKSIALSRQLVGQPIDGQVRGDLDWIVMKCLEKDRRRRYETPNELAADLERHLADETVSARPPTAAYRFRKSYRRNRAGYLGAAAVLLALLIGLGFATAQAIRARRAEKLAVEKRDEAAAIARFLTEVFQSPDPERSGYSFTVAEALRAAAARLDTDLSSVPERRAALQTTLGETYHAIGLPRESAALWEKVLAYRRAQFAPDDPETVRAMTRLADVWLEINRSQDAVALIREVVGIQQRRHGENSEESLDARDFLASALARNERFKESIELREAVLAQRRQLQGPEDPRTLNTLEGLAVGYSQAGRRKESLEVHRQVYEARRRVLGPEDRGTLWALANVAAMSYDDGQLDEAIRMQDQLVAARRKVLGPEHPDTLMALHYRAFYEQQRNASASIPLHREVLTLRRKVLGPENLQTIMTCHYLAQALEDAGRSEEATTVREDVVRLREASNGPDHPHTQDARMQLMDSYLGAGRYAEAMGLLGECIRGVSVHSTELANLALREAWFGQEKEFAAFVQRILTQADQATELADMERLSRALVLRPSRDLAVQNVALDLARRVYSQDTNGPTARQARFTVGLAELRSQRPAAAEPYLQQVASDSGPGSTLSNAAAFYRAIALHALGREAEARRVYAEAKTNMRPWPKNERNPLPGRLALKQLLPWLAYREARAVFEPGERGG
ncbi:MAG: tetratricopeptide repeat protein [Verrucomicrobia bacterium]|nr:tetratricopeptide repeat protein [Verrucomicrobiota bacterium]